jgi:hypothetical protein
VKPLISLVFLVLNLSLGQHLVLEVTGGEAFYRRSLMEDLQSVSSGTSLVGDEVLTLANTGVVVTLLCADNSVVTVRDTTLSSVPCKDDVNLADAVLLPPKTMSLSPLVLEPRGGRILSQRPTFYFAQENLTVILQDSRGNILWQTFAPQRVLVFPQNVLLLEAGDSYMLVVKSETGQEKTSFTILSQEAKVELTEARQTLLEAELSETNFALGLAELFSRYGLYHGALNVLETDVRSKTISGEVALRIARWQYELGLLEPARTLSLEVLEGENLNRETSEQATQLLKQIEGSQ